MDSFISSNISINNPSTIHSNSINNNTNIKKFWCHLCKKEFTYSYSETYDIPCIFCGKTFCEILEIEDINNPLHPNNFEPYIVNNNNLDNSDNNENNFNESSNNVRINIRNQRDRHRAHNRILELLTHYITIQNYNDDFDNLLNQIMINDTNKYGNPPASKNAIEKLKKCTIDSDKLKEFGVENSCAICKDEFIIGEECLLMPCQHHFHVQCLLPWLNERNSCPVCRFELPTDDKDFEERKKQKFTESNNDNN